MTTAADILKTLKGPATMTPNEILQNLRSSKFLIASRSNGYICPGTMRIVGFDEVLESGCVSFTTYTTYDGITRHSCYFRKGVYLIEDSGFRNVHREIKKLLMMGILEGGGRGIQKLRIKENA